MKDSDEKKYLFLAGGSRSGAALTGSILNAHSKISFSTDVIKYCGFAMHRFPKVSKSNINNLIEEFKLRLDIRFDIKFDTEMCLELIKEDFSHENIYKAFMKSIYKMDNKSIILGECENMSWDYIPFFIKKISNSKSLSIIRDPRDVMHSFKKNTIAKGNDYLINVFNTKALMQASLKYLSKYKNNFYVIKFENLKLNTENEVKKICNYINIDFEENMLNEKNWKVLKGAGWKEWENKKVSSFSESEKIHNPVRRWKGNIDIVDHFITEWILKNEMIKFGYKLEFENFNNDIFKEAIERLTSSNFMVKAFSDYLLNNVGSSQLPLDRFNPNFWDMRYVTKKNKIKKLSRLMGY